MTTIRPATEADWPHIWALFQSAASGSEVFAYDESTTEEVARKLWFDAPATCRDRAHGVADSRVDPVFVDMPGKRVLRHDGGLPQIVRRAPDAFERIREWRRHIVGTRR